MLSTRMANMDSGSVMQLQPWTATDFMYMLFMWAIMMIGMMLPSATPMTLLYAGMVRKAKRQGTPIAPTVAFVSGYLLMWCIFSIGATVAQWALHQTALLSPMMVTTSHALGASLLILAGLYQFTPWKNVCLNHCRSPVHFVSKHWRTGTGGALRMGLEHGWFCLGCCWALMGLLFVGGVMNLLWIAGITFVVFLEKVLPFRELGGRIVGILIIASGAVKLWLSS